MALPPLSSSLSDGQKIEVLKRFKVKYDEELKKLEVEMQEILTSLAEADFLASYLGEQPEVKELRGRKAEVEVMEARRQYLGKIIERLSQILPQQPTVSVPVPAGAPGKAPGLKRY